MCQVIKFWFESIEVCLTSTSTPSYRECQPCITYWMAWQDLELKQPYVKEVHKAGPNNLK